MKKKWERIKNEEIIRMKKEKRKKKHERRAQSKQKQRTTWKSFCYAFCSLSSFIIPADVRQCAGERSRTRLASIFLIHVMWLWICLPKNQYFIDFISSDARFLLSSPLLYFLFGVIFFPYCLIRLLFSRFGIVFRCLDHFNARFLCVTNDTKNFFHLFFLRIAINAIKREQILSIPRSLSIST